VIDVGLAFVREHAKRVRGPLIMVIKHGNIELFNFLFFHFVLLFEELNLIILSPDTLSGRHFG
jgi:hypothetical protein